MVEITRRVRWQLPCISGAYLVPIKYLEGANVLAFEQQSTSLKTNWDNDDELCAYVTTLPTAYNSAIEFSE